MKRDTVDGRNPANQLRLDIYPIIYKVLYIPGGSEIDLRTINSIKSQLHLESTHPLYNWERHGKDDMITHTALFVAPTKWKQQEFSAVNLPPKSGKLDLSVAMICM